MRPLHHLVPRRHRPHRRGRSTRHHRSDDMTAAPDTATTRTRELVAELLRNEFTRTDQAPADPIVEPRVHVVRAVIAETPNVVTLDVVPVDGDPAPFLPAQVSMLGAFGIGEAAISISSSAATRDHHEYTIRRAGAITTALCDMDPGDQFTIRGPFGRPWNLDAA